MQILLSAIVRPVRIQTASSRPSFSLSATFAGRVVIVIFMWEFYEMLPRFPETWLKTEEHNKRYPYRKPTNASNDHFIVMSSQMLLHVSAYQRLRQGAHTILTSYLYVGVHYNAQRRNM
jgi:hypothetical protein